MVKMYKLTTQENTTHGGMSWKIGKTNTAKGVGSSMCSDQVLHCYASPAQAVFLNPIHADIKNPRLYEIECSPIIATDGLKFACKKQTPTQELSPIFLSATQRVAIAIKIAILDYKESNFLEWANLWLNGLDRSRGAAAYAAAYAANAAANAAAYAADFNKTLQKIIEEVMNDSSFK